MLQWLPGSDREVVWNDREQGPLRVPRSWTLGPAGRVPSPPRSMPSSPDGRTGDRPQFQPPVGRASRVRLSRARRSRTGTSRARRLGRVLRRPAHRRAAAAGFGRARCSSSAMPFADWGQAKHYFIHLLFSPDGARFIFLHRWRTPREARGHADVHRRRRRQRPPPGRRQRHDFALHLARRATHPGVARTSPRTARGSTCSTTERTRSRAGRPRRHAGGRSLHLSARQRVDLERHLPGRAAPCRTRTCYEVATGRRVPLGHFHSPPEYTGEWRVDTHPRFSPDGKKVVIDSPHGGHGRQMYLIDIAGIVG